MDKKTIGVAIIAKNEEALIARCLASVAGADQCVVVDTGSTDRTIEIAKSFGAEVYYDFIWIDDFQAAANHAKSKLTTSWVLSIDCDEVLLTGIDSVREAISKAKDVVRVNMVAEGGEKNDFYFGRLFRNTPEIYWVASIHKHLNIPGIGEEVGNVSIMYGWSPAHLGDPDRSLRMLEKAVADGEGIPRNLYYLGREYSYKQRYQECIDTLEKYAEVSHWDAELADAYLIIAQAYRELKKSEECAVACFKAICVNSNFKEAIEFMTSIVMKENQFQWKRMARGANNEGVLWKRVEAEPVNDIIFLAPHNDDESLFGAYTLMRVKPLVIVVTDSWIQHLRGEQGCGPEARRQETIEAMKLIDCPVLFMGIPDEKLTEELLRERLKGLNPARVYAPAIHEGGNVHHNIVGKVALEMFGDRCERYTSYNSTEFYIEGNFEIKPTQEEKNLKGKMLTCYTSQVNLPSTRPHFEAVIDKPEWLL